MSAADLPEEVQAAASAAVAKNATDVVVLSVAEVSTIASHFVICTATSDRQVRAVAAAVEEAVGANGGPKPTSIEGVDSHEWVLINYGDLLVHIFQPETREFYSLERLWSDAPRTAWDPASLGPSATDQ